MLERGTTQTADQGPQRALSGKGSGIAVTAGMLAQKQPSFQKCVTAYRSSHPAPKMTGTKRRAAVADSTHWRRMVGERCPPPRSRTERTGGAWASAYAGTSNDKTGGKPVRRKHQVSWGRSIRPGSVGT